MGLGIVKQSDRRHRCNETEIPGDSPAQFQGLWIDAALTIQGSTAAQPRMPDSARKNSRNFYAGAEVM